MPDSKKNGDESETIEIELTSPVEADDMLVISRDEINEKYVVKKSW